jgi:hypothetical protein
MGLILIPFYRSFSEAPIGYVNAPCYIKKMRDQASRVDTQRWTLNMEAFVKFRGKFMNELKISLSSSPLSSGCVVTFSLPLIVVCIPSGMYNLELICSIIYRKSCNVG